MSDTLESLPTDEIPPRVNDQVYLDMLFKQQSKSNIQSFFQTLKEPLVYGLVFMVLNSQSVRSLLEGIVPYVQKSEMTFLLFKTFLFVFIAYLYTIYSSK